jgi:hypothetical protein
LFPKALRSFRPVPSPASCKTGSSFLTLSSTSENWPLQPAVRADTSGTFHGVSFLFASSALRVHLPMRFPFRISVPPSAFLTLSTVYSSYDLVSLFHPTSAFRICLTGVFPATQPTKLFAPSFLPSCRSCALSYSPASRSAPDPAPSTPGVCSVRRSVADHKGISLVVTRSPLRLCSLGLLSPPTLNDALTSPPLMTSFVSSSSDTDAGLQRFNRCLATPTVSSRRSRSSFFACSRVPPK